MRSCPQGLEDRFDTAKTLVSDINEHLPLLRELASSCEHVTEFGLRGADGSTIALLAGQPESFITYDINPFAVISEAVAGLVLLNANGGRTSFQPRVGDTLKVTIEHTDMLFIDSLHTARQLKAELTRHGWKVKKYLVFHDTTTFGHQGEDGSTPGLRTAIRQFQKYEQFPLWQLIEDRDNNNGLVVLERAYPWPFGVPPLEPRA